MGQSQGKFFLKVFAALAVIAGVLWWLQQKAEEPPPPTPPSATTATTPAPGGRPSTPVPTARDMIPAIAQRAGVTVVSTSEQSGWLLVTVQSRDRNALGDFMDEAVRAGMKDMDTSTQQYKQLLDAQQRQVFQATFKMRF